MAKVEVTFPGYRLWCDIQFAGYQAGRSIVLARSTAHGLSRKGTWPSLSSESCTCICRPADRTWGNTRPTLTIAEKGRVLPILPAALSPLRQTYMRYRTRLL